MNAPERILKIIEHEEADKVPAFESAFTNNTIMRYYGIDPRTSGGYKGAYEFFYKVGIDLVLTAVSLFPRTFLKGKQGFIDEYGRLMKFENSEDGTQILAYHGGHFKSFEDYESWEQPDPHFFLFQLQDHSWNVLGKDLDLKPFQEYWGAINKSEKYLMTEDLLR